MMTLVSMPKLTMLQEAMQMSHTIARRHNDAADRGGEERQSQRQQKNGLDYSTSLFTRK
jgi:hypothetical protein